MDEPDQPPQPSDLGPTPWRGHPSVGPQFHYRRAEREEQQQRSTPSLHGGFFRRNRGLTLTIIDLVIVAALFAIVTFVVLPLQARGRIGPYRLQAEAVWVGDAVLTTVEVRDGDFGDRDAPPPSQVVQIRAGGQSASDLVPMLAPSRLIRMRLEPEQVVEALQGNDLRLEVIIGGESVELSTSIDGDAPVSDAR